MRNGSERVVTSSREHIYDLRSLENYSFIDENGKDQGVNVRHKTRELIDFIQDDDKLRDERKKAKKNKDKYIGMSSDAMGMRYGGGSNSFDDFRYRDRDREEPTRNRYDERSCKYSFIDFLCDIYPKKKLKGHFVNFNLDLKVSSSEIQEMSKNQYFIKGLYLNYIFLISRF